MSIGELQLLTQLFSIQVKPLRLKSVNTDRTKQNQRKYYTNMWVTDISSPALTARFEKNLKSFSTYFIGYNLFLSSDAPRRITLQVP